MFKPKRQVGNVLSYKRVQGKTPLAKIAGWRRVRMHQN